MSSLRWFQLIFINNNQFNFCNIFMAIKKPLPNAKCIPIFSLFVQAPTPPTTVLQNVFPENFWTYVNFKNQDIHSVEQFLQGNHKELTNILNQLYQKNLFRDTIINFTKQMGGQVHPLIIESPGLTSEIPVEDQQDETGEYLTFNNLKVDWLTLKLIQTFFPLSQIQCLHFNNNLFSPMEIVKISEILAKEVKIFKLFYENNPIKYAEVDQQNYITVKKFFINLGSLSHLEFLSLRGNQLDNDFAIEFIQKVLSNPLSKLRFLELSNNQISKQGVEMIAELLKTKNKLEYLGLAKINISGLIDVKKLLQQVGKHKLSHDEHQKQGVFTFIFWQEFRSQNNKEKQLFKNLINKRKNTLKICCQQSRHIFKETMDTITRFKMNN